MSQFRNDHTCSLSCIHDPHRPRRAGVPELPVRFSTRAPADLAPSRLAVVRAACEPVACDLTNSNPTTVGIHYPADLLAPLADPAGLRYAPDPRGTADARAAVAADHLRRGLEVDPDRIVLTASTSEAYSLLFKLLCEPGDAVAVPVPSYPLFEHLLQADAASPAPYRLSLDDGWRVEIGDLEAAPEATRAAIVVHPNNPTGSFVHRDDADALVGLCRERGWALIADEVFLDYPLGDDPAASRSFAGEHRCPTFVLGGLSKSCGLPQLKLGWIIVNGSGAEASLDRLDFLADTYLSVGTPVQLALPRLLPDAAVVRDRIARRCRDNLVSLDRLVARCQHLELLRPAAGWSAVLRYPAVVDEEELAVELLERDGVAVHPGYLFDFQRPGFLVVSLLPEPVSFTAGTAAVAARIATHLGV